MKAGDKVRVVAVEGTDQFDLADSDVGMGGIRTGKIYPVARILEHDEQGTLVYLDRGQGESEWAMFPEMLELVVE